MRTIASITTAARHSRRTTDIATADHAVSVSSSVSAATDSAFAATFAASTVASAVATPAIAAAITAASIASAPRHRLIPATLCRWPTSRASSRS
jgi:hypothetical protein